MNPTNQDYVSLATRLLISILFLYSGLGKILAFSATTAYISKTGVPFPELAYAGALFIEIGCALALVLGYRTTIAAVLMAVFSLITALLFHSNFAEKMQTISFLKNIAICGGLLHIAAFPQGIFSLDAWRTSKKNSTGTLLSSRA